MLTKEQILQSRWYRQSGAGLPVVMSVPFEAIGRTMHKLSGFRAPNYNGGVVWTGKNYTFFNYFNHQDFSAEFSKVLELQATNPDYFRSLHSKMLENGRAVDARGQEMLDLDPKSQDFMAKFTSFLQTSFDFWGYSLVLDLFDQFEDRILEHVFGERRKELTIRQINLLTCTDELSHIQKEQQDLLAIYEQAQRTGMGQQTEDSIRRHAQEYWWIQNNFESARRLGPDYFRQRLQEMLADPKIAHQIRLNLDNFKEENRRKKALLSELKFGPRIEARLAFFNWITNFRDDRKYFVQISNHYILQARDRIASALNIQEDLLTCATASDLSDLLRGDASVMPKLKVRKGYGLMFYVDLEDHIEIISGPEAIKYQQMFEQTVMGTEIRGSTASLGRATGTVRIILSEQDFPKLQEGDVLVAPMTRPEYVPIMKKAVAIVTDEGGLTCHAAIVSRELGIPCIIGTQTATQTLKDGEVIEVDANHNIIKHIT